MRTTRTKAAMKPTVVLGARNEGRPWPFCLSLGVLFCAACSSGSPSPSESAGTTALQLTSPLAGADAGTVMVGSPCDPDQQSDPSFQGFDTSEISVETLPNAPSGAPVCLIDHFNGLVSCPYGQDASGAGPDGGAGCETPGGVPVTVTVLPQCADRPPASTVFWSCRCANVDGGTGDDTYCVCPSGSSCTPSLASIGTTDENIVGSYCVPPAAIYAPATACTVKCNPTAHPCP
jgi:hypothetical protein